MEGKIVFEGKTEKGIPILVRYPTKDDASAMCAYINKLSKEKTFITFQGEEITLEYEIDYLKKQLQRVAEQKTVHLLAFLDDNLVGISQIDLKDRTSSHEGVFGISIAEEYRNKGIGKLLMCLALEEAEKNLLQLKIITLSIFGGNDLAYKIYEKFGFKEFGRLPKGILHKGKYVDHIYMYKNVGD